MSVALRTITRLQDADDINVSLGAGVDEYALCWDNDTARFVLLAGLAAAALADGPTLWKEYCPRHHDVVLMAADDWDGVHVLCVRAARPEEPTDKVR